MSRAKGQKSPGFEARRRELIAKARTRLAVTDGGHVSLRELATACGVTVPTMQHYFGRRDGIIAAVMAQQLADGAPHLARVAEPEGTFAVSVRSAADYVVFGFNYGLGDVFSVGFIEGLRNTTIGPEFLASIIEPTLEVFARRLQSHIDTGEMRPSDPRFAALSLFAPVLLACLHQLELGGRKDWPLDMQAFLTAHCDGFVRAYAAETSAS